MTHAAAIAPHHTVSVSGLTLLQACQVHAYCCLAWAFRWCSLLGLEAPVMTPNGVLFLLFCRWWLTSAWQLT